VVHAALVLFSDFFKCMVHDFYGELGSFYICSFTQETWLLLEFVNLIKLPDKLKAIKMVE